MMTNAERQRRFRSHRKGDHSLCDPNKCEFRRGSGSGEALRQPVKPSTGRKRATAEFEPVNRGPRAQRLWSDMDGENLEPPQRLLLEEICRIADRLDRLDAQIDGRESWLTLVQDDQSNEVIVTVDNLLAEARQHATALRGLVSELRSALPKTPAKPAAPTPKAGGLGDLSARIADRRRASAG